MINDEQLTKNFRLYDFLKSNTAERYPDIKKKNFNPSIEIITELKKTSIIIQKIYDYVLSKHHGCILRITSGYRCVELNKLIGGSATSQHCLGQATDYEIYDKNGKEVDGKIYKDVAMWVNTNIQFRQQIKEFGTASAPSWLHIAQRDGDNKKQNLEIGGHTGGKYITLDFNKWTV